MIAIAIAKVIVHVIEHRIIELVACWLTFKTLQIVAKQEVFDDFQLTADSNTNGFNGFSQAKSQFTNVC